ncbi:hypothetical protein [Pseudomonas purpurea]|uniref:hypothetical protein n=1 Tax=Pseudomonas purpurea TaxID=3136737 RepID=UPI003264374E
MSFEDAITIIESFWIESPLPLVGAGAVEVQRISEEWQADLPAELSRYIQNFAPDAACDFSTVGNSVTLYAAGDIKKLAKGYNFNPVTNEHIEGWSDDWVLIGDEGADPIIVDLSEGPACPVFLGQPGRGEWCFSPVADSLPQFLVLLSARHHAVLGFDVEDSIIDDESGFNLAPEPAAWYFPFMKKHAGDYYPEWTGDFDNA